MSEMHLALGCNHAGRMHEEITNFRNFMRGVDSHLLPSEDTNAYMTVR